MVRLSGSGDTVTYTYDTSGYLASITNELSQVLRVPAVNGRGEPTTVVDAGGITSNLTYDSEGRLKTVAVDPSGTQRHHLDRLHRDGRRHQDHAAERLVSPIHL